MKTTTNVKFHPGRVVATPGALEALERNSISGAQLLKRHLQGDWGVLTEEDQQANEDALLSGARIFSSYLLADKTKLWVITEAADGPNVRPSTCLLLPDEY